MKKLKNILLIAIACACSCAIACAQASTKSLQGKTLCVFGDSYAKNHRCPASETWHAKAAEALGMAYANMGRNGSSILFDRSAEGFGKAMPDRLAELPDSIDCLLLIAGHNDAYMLGDIENLPKFSAALSGLLDSLKRKYPSAKIGYVTPWHVDRPYFTEVIDEINAVCARHGVPVFDAEKAGGIAVNDPGFRAAYFQDKGVNDTAHLNSAGHDLIAGAGADFILSLMAD